MSLFKNRILNSELVGKPFLGPVTSCLGYRSLSKGWSLGPSPHASLYPVPYNLRSLGFNFAGFTKIGSFTRQQIQQHAGWQQ